MKRFLEAFSPWKRSRSSARSLAREIRCFLLHWSLPRSGDHQLRNMVTHMMKAEVEAIAIYRMTTWR